MPSYGARNADLAQTSLKACAPHRSLIINAEVISHNHFPPTRPKKQDIPQILRKQAMLGLRHKFSAATHDLDISRITEHAVALPGGQLLDDAEPLKVVERLVDRGRSDAGLFNQ